MDQRALLLYSLGVLQAYFLGAIPFGFVLVKLLKGIDVRTAGSGNIGATNVGRVAGRKIGILAFILDVAKGFVAVTWIPFTVFALAAGHYTYSGLWHLVREATVGKGFGDLRIACGLAAVAGHVWTIFLSFKGGKGVATSLGVLLGLAPWPSLATLFLWAIVTRVSGYVSLGSVVAAVVLPVAIVVVEWRNLTDSSHLVIFSIVVAAIVLVRHRGNVRRLLDGTENRLSFRHGSRIR